jgi:hypothetical protein
MPDIQLWSTAGKNPADENTINQKRYEHEAQNKFYFRFEHSDWGQG